jgi:tetratricopeptide (TPR) repeat protein
MSMAVASAATAVRRPERVSSKNVAEWQLQETRNQEDLLQQVTEINACGMEALRAGEARTALKSLFEAHGLLANYDTMQDGSERAAAVIKCQADTASNLGICHKRMGARAAAVQFLQRALRLYMQNGADLRTLIAVHLNLSASFADVKVMDQALVHAKEAVNLGGRLIAEAAAADAPSEPRTDDFAMLAVAYHKVAEACEGLKDWGPACLAYTQAYEVVRKSLGPEHRLTRSFERSARCPRRAIVPEVPCSLSMQQNRLSGRRRLPEIPRGDSRRPKTPQENFAHYHLGQEHFATWPPLNVSEAEQQWYAMAQKQKVRERQQELALLRHGGEPSQALGSVRPATRG